MPKHYTRIANVFNESELILLEDALRKYEQSKTNNLSEKGEDILIELRQTITNARRWKHQSNKSQH